MLKFLVFFIVSVSCFFHKNIISTTSDLNLTLNCVFYLFSFFLNEQKTKFFQNTNNDFVVFT